MQPRDAVSGTVALRFAINNAIPPVKLADITWTYVNSTSGNTVDVISSLVDYITDTIGDASTLGGRFYMSTSLQNLTIFQLQKSDRGMYTLTAKNIVGSSNATIHLDVHSELKEHYMYVYIQYSAVS